MATPTTVTTVRHVDKLYLELLFRCNFRCLHRYHGADLDRPDQLPAEHVEAALDVFRDRYGCQQVCFLGGEPLLYPDLPRVLQAARERGYHTEVCTNGYRRRQMLERCAPHLDLLRVSLDGGTADTHDHLRRLGSFHAAMDTLTWAVQHGLRAGATCTLTGANIHTIPQLARRLADLGACELYLHRVRLVGNAATSNLPPVTWEQTRHLYDQLVGMQPELGGLGVNRDILLPERCPTPDDGTVEKLEIAPDGRIYRSCAQVGGHADGLRYDFAHAQLQLAPTHPPAATAWRSDAESVRQER